MSETNGTNGTSADLPELHEMKEAYEAFQYIWNKLPRSMKPERDNHSRMTLLRDFFERQLTLLEAQKRALIAGAVLGAGTEDSTSTAPTSSIHVALQVCRLLNRKQWEMVKSYVDLHKFQPEDVAELMAELRDTHCADCGVWLEDDDNHEDCAMRTESAGTATDTEVADALMAAIGADVAVPPPVDQSSSLSSTVEPVQTSPLPPGG